MNSTQCNKNFWSHFFADYHNQEIFASGGFYQGDPIDAHSLFTTVVNCCKHVENRQWGVRLFIDGKAKLSGSGLDDVDEVRMYFPTHEDAGFEGYHSKMEKLCREYCLIINDPERMDFNLYHWCRQFLKPIFQHNGMNNIGIYNALFIGNYSKTSFGVHFDPESIFQFPIVGSKTMRFWSAEYVFDNPELAESLHYQEHLSVSRSLISHPGEFTYWPKKMWHIAENSGEFSVAMALSLHEYSNITPYIVNNLLLPQLTHERHLNDQFELSGTPSQMLNVTSIEFQPTSFTAIHEVPQDIRQAFQRLSYLTSHVQAKKFWLRMVSSFGFTSPPIPQEGNFNRQQRYRLYPDFPMLMQQHGQDLYIAANGHLLTCKTEHEQILSFINYINSHDILRGEEIYQASEKFDANLADQLLTFLYAAQVLTAVR
ncbi:JmjC domain-containing protein [Xenorhabdus bovienii]|uniref:JmjC domain-containing protein n=1 Tax=Xenorhabdus bovienii TaxID=40576 RepID=UPI0023B27B7D|nr:cupin domain-containing protein [Xenorhabdus bovienii]MDE9467187.1 hypothetical protein [Xenorhabdus bovienii]